MKLRTTIAKIILLLSASCALAAAADVNWYYTIEETPAGLPGALPGAAGVLVLVKKPADDANVCVSYATTDGAARQVCKSAHFADSGYPYAPVRINLGAAAADFKVTAIAVTVGSTTKSIDAPAAAVEY